MQDFDLWVITTRKRRYFALMIEDDEIVTQVELEGGNVSLIATLQIPEDK